MRTFEVLYEDGVLKPERPLPFSPGQRLNVVANGVSLELAISLGIAPDRAVLSALKYVALKK